MKEFRKDPTFWMSGWLSEAHTNWRTVCFNVIDEYLPTPPKTILDIGCGIAFESRLFHKKYDTELWLLDGDVKNNQTQQEKSVGWNEDVKTFRFYSNLEDLKKVFDNDSINNYKLIDANNIDIPAEQKFDLICSYSSCGVHYPLNTYKELILKHSHKDTICIFDLRNRTLQNLKKEINIIKILQNPKPADPMNHIKAHFKFKQ